MLQDCIVKMEESKMWVSGERLLPAMGGYQSQTSEVTRGYQILVIPQRWTGWPGCNCVMVDCGGEDYTD